MSAVDDTDAELVARVLSGERAVYTELVARHQNVVVGFLCSRLRTREACASACCRWPRRSSGRSAGTSV